ncbi:hypothetical protein [Novosphingobium humi]|uniref:Uncharacterized protein n=1 Tax=Novosphingobium humi TaxID=2282397 RepID=A0ABY7TZK0_9SPHN|nr:hypothetical protein [Novosphingobium humi]WCT78688.1 hypothetical protein PQ457_06910 [Novosphingobium humi]
MALDPTAIEQVKAAWAGADASIAQAVSGIIAIIVSLRIAHQANRRAEKAEKDAAERIREANREAERRVEAMRIEEYNQPLLKIIFRLDVAIPEAKEHLDNFRKTSEKDKEYYYTGLSTYELSEIMGDYESLKHVAPCQKSFAAIRRLRAFLPCGKTDYPPINSDYYIAQLEEQIAELVAIRNELEASLKKLPA